MEPLRFLHADVSGPPAPGWYVGTIATACWRQSARDNRMVYVVHALEDVSSPFDRISDYFVLEGATPRGLAYSRKRLVELFRACGLSPQAGDEIRPGELQGFRIEVEVTHDLWKGDVRLRVVGYRPRTPLPDVHEQEPDNDPEPLFLPTPQRWERSHE